MGNEQKDDLRSPCVKCNSETYHDTLCEHKERGDRDYDYSLTHSVVECRGCKTKSFRYHYVDIENAYPVDDDEWDVPSETKTYPRSIKGHTDLDGIEYVSEIVKMIYRETLLAIQEDALISAGLGLRGTVEAICNDRGITGRSLDTRISKLATQGLISQKDADRLHAIRFMGNDAAHDIKKPDAQQISVALKIIEHLIQSIYILENEAMGRLETMVDGYDSFRELLSGLVEKMSSGEEVPLIRIVGRHIRRIRTPIADLDKQLVGDISAGNYTKLAIGKVDYFAGSTAALQHFIVT